MTSSDDHAPKPSLQQERSLEEQAVIQKIIDKSPFAHSSMLHAEYVQKKVQELDMLKPEKILTPQDSAQMESQRLAAAEAELIEALNEKMKLETLLKFAHEQNEQANARIKELEWELEHVNKANASIAGYQQREQPLVEALEDISERTVDGPDAWDVARRALKKQRGGL